MTAKILIVEDEPIIRLDLQLRLERMGHRVVGVASRGEEAVAKATELHPDLVLMDVRLDGAMDGMEAARRIRAAEHTPVIYLTAHASTLRLAKQGDGTGPFLSKPLRTVELESTIAQMLASLESGNKIAQRRENAKL